MQRNLLLSVCLLGSLSLSVSAQDVLYIPRLESPPVIDGQLDEWKDVAFNDGVWDINRISHNPWYDDGRRNRLTVQREDEPHPFDDLRARYYAAWDDEWLYLGAEVVDNYNDIVDPEPADRRWMFKDSICWFIEAPGDDAPEWFGRGDNAFCFVIDDSYPDYAAWWRHGAPGETYLEDPIPADGVDFRLTMNPWGTGEGDFILEARVKMDLTFPISDPDWQPPHVGDEYRMEIVHTDPDGGAYGGHFMIYGTGDDDSSWGRMILVGPREPIERLAQ